MLGSYQLQGSGLRTSQYVLVSVMFDDWNRVFVTSKARPLYAWWSHWGTADPSSWSAAVSEPLPVPVVCDADGLRRLLVQRGQLIPNCSFCFKVRRWSMGEAVPGSAGLWLWVCHIYDTYMTPYI